MPRQVRIEYPGATYHVMCRGDRQEWIFADDNDREMFLVTLAEAIGDREDRLARACPRLRGQALTRIEAWRLVKPDESEVTI